MLTPRSLLGVNDVGGRGWGRHGFAVMAKRVDVQFDGLGNQISGLFKAIPTRDTPRQVGHIGRVASVIGLLYHYDVLHKITYFNPACLSMLLKVPGGTSRESLPPAATVTVPGLLG